MMIRTLVASVLLAMAGQSAADEPIRLAGQELSQRQLMIFQSGQSLFSERYRLAGKTADRSIEIADINPQLQPGSTLVEGVGDIEQIALIMPQNGIQQRLEGMIGQNLGLKRYAQDGSAIYREARLLGIEGNQLLLEDGERVEYLPLQSDWQLLLPGPAPRYSDTPYLRIKRSGDAADNLSLSYMGGGLNWQADYALTLEAQSNTLWLQAQATLSNHTGIDLPQSQVRLLAGQVNQPQGAPRLYMAKAVMEMAADSMPAEQAFEDYRLYSLSGSVDLPTGASTSVALMPMQKLTYRNSYQFQMPVYGNAQPEPIQGRPNRTIRFTLPQQDKREFSLPAGNARVYVQDQTAGLSFIGGQNLPAHAAGEEVEMVLGQVFDIGIEQTQSLYERQGNTTRLAYQVTLSNAGKQRQTVELTADFNQNWRITQSSHPAQSQGARALWSIDIPAEGSTTLSYQVELTRR
ncbi:hypothetical protein GCM10011352_10190 [Marinobacterium zhoushanense]|uniref:DUF4139 domain-containing protein n=1 Tax=Marinobacterium zhoushanense TaxID=1679163 RepID=A0ABQ1K8N5_9GAMM|nr:DUF4139 domain-containing protein [Marinobacterium zhoushanense]GGB86252.1 hypothetical protein GCM10011352_10190 [Marinobacterium zhoushanense]